MQAELHFQQQLLPHANSQSQLVFVYPCIHDWHRARLSPVSQLCAATGAVSDCSGAEMPRCRTHVQLRDVMSFPVIHFHCSNDKIWRGHREQSIMCFWWESVSVRREVCVSPGQTGVKLQPSLCGNEADAGLNTSY